MTPDESKAHEKALGALIAASLRSPLNEPEVTEQDIKRFVEQSVTLNAEDKAALEKAEPEFLTSVAKILIGTSPPDDDCIEANDGSECKEPYLAMNRKNAVNEFTELTDSALDRKRKEMLARIKQKKGHGGA